MSAPSAPVADQVTVEGRQPRVITAAQAATPNLGWRQAGERFRPRLSVLPRGSWHDAVHFLRVSMSSSDVGGELRGGEQPVQPLVSADETQLAGPGGLVLSHVSSPSVVYACGSVVVPGCEDDDL